MTMPGEKNKKYKEFIGLDLKFFNDENIIEIIKIIENSIKNDLNQILGLRSDEYTISVGVEVDEELRISIDLDVKAYLHGKINLYNILDKVIDHAFNSVKIYLKQFKGRNKITNSHS
uniref:DUF3194 domain-containing protein n=1 Tax=Ignisphaera aggregans TaxID=334771 RepID=A0A7J3QD98_9CREN